MDLSNHFSAHINDHCLNDHCRRGIAPRRNSHRADIPGCCRPLHLGVCCPSHGLSANYSLAVTVKAAYRQVRSLRHLVRVEKEP
jgi:hypothetical protein